MISDTEYQVEVYDIAVKGYSFINRRRLGKEKLGHGYHPAGTGPGITALQ